LPDLVKAAVGSAAANSNKVSMAAINEKTHRPKEIVPELASSDLCSYIRPNRGEISLRRSKIVTAFVLCVIALPLATCALYKPARVLTPEAYGMTCPNAEICIDDLSALPEATRLRTEAFAFVEATLGEFKKPPRVLFCKTKECFDQFGSQRIRGQNIGTSGSVINSIGWQDYIVRHEMIHHLQNERFGIYNASLRLPRWFIEGMAYSVSQDPRRPLPNAEIEEYRQKYEAWVAAGNDWQTPPK